MRREIISRHGNLLVRRLVLEPGEATPWHTDECRRFTVVVQGQHLRIETDPPGREIDVATQSGMAGWDEPDRRAHRAVNVGAGTYEEVVMFFLDEAGSEPQPEAAPSRAAGLPAEPGG